MNSIKVLVFILTVSAHFTLLSQGPNQTDAQGRKQGKWIVLFENSRVPQYEGQFKDGKPFGKFTYYYPSKKVKAIMQFENNGTVSRAVMYEEDGKLMAYGKYVNQQKDSVWTHFAPSGHTSYKETFKNGTLHGKKTIYYIPEHPEQKTQQVAQEYHYKNGKLSGEVKEYFPNGTLKSEGTYVNENYDGVVKKYHPNGKIMIIERYKNNLKHGWWMGYDENGKEIGRRYFWNGRELKGDKLTAHLDRLKAERKNPNE